MKAFNMYVKTIITSEHNKVLLLKEKTENKRPLWDLPGCQLDDEESFDEAILDKIPNDIGYLTYPGQIIGTTIHNTQNQKELYLIMEADIINGQILLSDKYESYVWVNLNRITEYPLAPWLNNYVKHTEHPFNDVEIEINELDEEEPREREVVQEDIGSYTDRIPNTITDTFNSRNEDIPEPSEKKSESGRGSLGLLRDAISRTFHPRAAEVRETEPKRNLYHDYEDKTPVDDNIEDRFNVKFDSQEEEPHITVENREDDILIDHSDNYPIVEEPYPEQQVMRESKDEIIIDHGTEDTKEEPSPVLRENPDDIIIDHSDDETVDKVEPQNQVLTRDNDEIYVEHEPDNLDTVANKNPEPVRGDTSVKASQDNTSNLDEVIKEDEIISDDTLESTPESPEIGELLAESDTQELSMIEDDTTPKSDPLDDMFQDDTEEIIIDHSDDEEVDQYERIRQAYGMQDDVSQEPEKQETQVAQEPEKTRQPEHTREAHTTGFKTISHPIKPKTARSKLEPSSNEQQNTQVRTSINNEETRIKTSITHEAPRESTPTPRPETRNETKPKSSMPRPPVQERSNQDKREDNRSRFNLRRLIRRNDRNTDTREARENNVNSEANTESRDNINREFVDMNYNREQNTRRLNANSENNVRQATEPKIKVIHRDEEVPHIRTEKESDEKVSFDSENINRGSWRERIDDINRTDANKKKRKVVPRPKGKK